MRSSSDSWLLAICLVFSSARALAPAASEWMLHASTLELPRSTASVLVAIAVVDSCSVAGSVFFARASRKISRSELLHSVAFEEQNAFRQCTCPDCVRMQKTFAQRKQRCNAMAPEARVWTDAYRGESTEPKNRRLLPQSAEPKRARRCCQPFVTAYAQKA